MERLTNDDPQTIFGNAVNLFYAKDNATWVRGGGPWPEYEDVTLSDFTRRLIKEYAPDACKNADSITDSELGEVVACWIDSGVDCMEGVIALMYTVGWAFAELRHRLKAYEDTGLEPEEIREVQAAMAPIPFGRFRDIMEAERAGRLVVLSTPMIPLVQGEDSMDTDVYCPRCGESVSGGWPNAEPDSEWKLCQCPYCGQSIDDWKVITREEAERALEGGGDHG